jgi:hypothetical protein
MRQEIVRRRDDLQHDMVATRFGAEPAGGLRIVPLLAVLPVLGRYRGPGVAVGTGTLPPLPGSALSSAQPVSNITATTTHTATTTTMIRAVFVRAGTGRRS